MNIQKAYFEVCPGWSRLVCAIWMFITMSEWEVLGPASRGPSASYFVFARNGFNQSLFKSV